MAAGIGVEAMKEVAKAYQARSLQDFQSTLSAYKEELVDDAVVHLHLSRLYDTLLEQNLCRLIEPYSRVEIEYLAKLIKLPTKAVLTKLSQVSLWCRQGAYLLVQLNHGHFATGLPYNGKKGPLLLQLFSISTEALCSSTKDHDIACIDSELVAADDS